MIRAYSTQRFTTKQIETPKAVFGVSEEREPGRPVGGRGPAV